MRKQKLPAIELELKKRWKFPYKWFQRQNNQWDFYTNFIYQTANWDDLNLQIEAAVEQYKLDRIQLFNYTINRWYNFWSAMAIEQVFTEIEGVTPAKNRKDREVDFELFGINFDHKTSVFPKHLKNDLNYAKANTRELIEWFYKNQSSQNRHHFKNRLFVVVYSLDGEHWKLKAELQLLKSYIQNYVAKFSEENLYSFTFTSGIKTYSDIIWVTK